MKSFAPPARFGVTSMLAILLALTVTPALAAEPGPAPSAGEVVRLGAASLRREELRRAVTATGAREQDVVLGWLRDRTLDDVATARKLSPPAGFIEREVAETRRELEAGREARLQKDKAVAAALAGWTEAAEAGQPPAGRAEAAWKAVGGEKNGGGFGREELLKIVGDLAADAEASARFQKYVTSGVDELLSAARPAIERAGRHLAAETALAGDVTPSPAEIDAVRAGLPAELKQVAAKDPGLAARMAEDGKRRRSADKALFAEIRKSAKFADAELGRLVKAEMEAAIMPNAMAGQVKAAPTAKARKSKP